MIRDLGFGIRTLAIVAIAAVSASAQPGARRATNIAALQSFPGFYHGRPILIVGTVAVDKDQIRVSDEAGSIWSSRETRPTAWTKSAASSGTSDG